jgi:hypothetical protein
MKFNPFEKDFEEIDLRDLDKLIDQEVSEGWYVEFKEDFPSAKKIGRSVAAFANSDGGWLIIGIKSNKQTNKAEVIAGINLSDNDNPVDRIRDIIKNHVIPIPYFKSKLIKLDNEQGVLVIFIRSGDEAPYLTKEGKIYRRIGEGSDPIPESDRYTIQKLFERSLVLKDHISNFCNNEFILPKSDENLSFLEAYFYCTPIDSFNFNDFISREFAEELKDIFSNPVPFIEIEDHDPINITTNFVISNLSSSHYSYILRSITNKDEAITIRNMVEIYCNGNLKLFFALPQFDNYLYLHKEYPNSQHLSSFAKIMQHYRMLRVIDGYNLFITYITLINHYKKLLKSYKFDSTLRGRIRLTNLWRSIIFIDSIEYIDFIEKYGPPICLKDEMEIPPNYERMGFKFDIYQDSTFIHIWWIFEALGFPIAFMSGSIIDLFEHMANKSIKPNLNK